MLKNWRFWFLGLLFFGPPAVHIALGAAWLSERGWILYGFLAWMTTGLIFGVLSVRWTRYRRTVLPPLDWNAPRTFAPRDVEAWRIVQAEAEQAERASIKELSTLDLYGKTGLRLAERLSKVYQPKASDAVERVPLTQLLTALELAADDLGRMIREIPGGDMVTLAHWKAAMQAAGFVSKANDYYNYLLPLFQPVQGVLRLGAHKLMNEPAWRNMQQNMMQWFYRAYIQRLGTHLIELYSERLSIGAARYRRLTGRASGVGMDRGADSEARPTLNIAVVGARGADTIPLARMLETARQESPERIRASLERLGADPALAEWFDGAVLREVEGYPPEMGKDSLRGRWARHSSVSQASEADLLLLVIDATREDFRADGRFLEEWRAVFEREPALEIPPALIVLSGADNPALLGVEDPAAPRAKPTKAALDAALRGRVEVLRRAMPSNMPIEIVTLASGDQALADVSRLVLPELVRLLPMADRVTLIRHLRDEATRSKSGRFFSQVGRQGRRLWDNMAGNVLRHVGEVREKVAPSRKSQR